MNQHRTTLMERFSVRRIGLFGSAVHGQARPDSDVDVLVEFEQPTFDHYMELKFFLEDLFQSPVDLVLADSLKPRIKPRVLAETVYA
ncbi:MAG TPA: nucleotidyltransferase family protein [Verrucomicrobiae bacterium]